MAERLACAWRQAAAAHAAAVRGRGTREHPAAAARGGVAAAGGWGEPGEPAAKRCRLGGAAGEAAAQGLQLLAQGLQLLHEAAPQVQAELAQHVQAAQRLLRPAAPLV